MVSLNKIDYICATIIAALFTLLTWQYFPCVDDCIYAFNSVTGEPIRTIKDAIISNWYDYHQVNGRFLDITTCTLLCSFKSIPVYSVITGCLFGILLLSSTYLLRHFDEKHRAYPIDVIALAICYMLFIPKWSICFGGNITCVVNYLWSASFYVSYLALLLWIRNKAIKNYLKVLLLLMALVVGSWQESFSLGISAALFVYILVHRKDLCIFEWLYVCLFFVGVIFSLVAPGNWARMGDSGNVNPITMSNLLKLLVDRVSSWLTYPIFFVIPFTVILLSIFEKGRTLLKEIYMLWIPMICMLLFAIFIAYTNAWQLCIVGVLGSIFILNVVRTSRMGVLRGGGDRIRNCHMHSVNYYATCHMV